MWLGQRWVCPPASGEIEVARFGVSAKSSQEQSTTLAFTSQVTIGRTGLPYPISEENAVIHMLVGYHFYAATSASKWRVAQERGVR